MLDSFYTYQLQHQSVKTSKNQHSLTHTSSGIRKDQFRHNKVQNVLSDKNSTHKIIFYSCLIKAHHFSLIKMKDHTVILKGFYVTATNFQVQQFSSKEHTFDFISHFQIKNINE